MSEADKIIKSLRDSGRKVEEFYTGNKGSDKNVANEERLNNFIEAYKQTKEQSFIVDSINKDFFFEFVDCLLAEREQDKKRIQKINKVIEYCKRFEYETEPIQDDDYLTERALVCGDILELLEGGK